MSNKVRIIGGDFARRWVNFSTDQARPTLGRIRETLFQWLVPCIVQSRVLDAFAGTGILSFEALSRGANQALCYDVCPRAAKDINNTARILGIENNIQVQQACFISSMQRYCQHPFDIIFLDPPFGQFYIDEILESLVKKTWLHSKSLVYVEYTKRENMSHPDFVVYKHKSTSTLNYSLLKVR